jgi:hypothetical protein
VPAAILIGPDGRIALPAALGAEAIRGLVNDAVLLGTTALLSGDERSDDHELFIVEPAELLTGAGERHIVDGLARPSGSSTK